MEDRILVSENILSSNKQKLERLCNKEKIILVKPEWSENRYINYSQPEVFEDREKDYRHSLSQYNMLAKAANYGFDNIPYALVDSGRIAYLMALAYGCQMIKMPTVISAKALITDPKQIDAITKTENIHECGIYPEIIARMKEFEKRYGAVDFVPSDTQSPFDVFTEIFRMEDALLAMYDDEDERIFRLLEMITQSIIEITEYEKSSVTNWVHGNDYPLSRGIHLSDDNAAFISPEIYKKYCQPYVEKISEHFGGVTLHCCMKYTQNIEIMSKTKGFMGFDPQFRFHSNEQIYPYIKDNGFLRVWWLPDCNDKFEVYKNIIDSSDGICGLMLEIFEDSEDEALRLAYKVKDYAIKTGRV